MKSMIDIQSYIQPVLYILNKAKMSLDTHKISKILYFADREHLAKYGNSITQDTYIAMKYGPVPSHIYDIIKVVLGNNSDAFDYDFLKFYFEKSTDNKISAKISFDIDEFSTSEIECLNNSITEYLDKPFMFLTNASHDLAWDSAIDSMDILKIAEAGGANQSMINYIRENNNISNAKFY